MTPDQVMSQPYPVLVGWNLYLEWKAAEQQREETEAAQEAEHRQLAQGLKEQTISRLQARG